MNRGALAAATMLAMTAGVPFGGRAPSRPNTKRRNLKKLRRRRMEKASRAFNLKRAKGKV